MLCVITADSRHGRAIGLIVGGAVVLAVLDAMFVWYFKMGWLKGALSRESISKSRFLFQKWGKMVLSCSRRRREKPFLHQGATPWGEYSSTAQAASGQSAASLPSIGKDYSGG